MLGTKDLDHNVPFSKPLATKSRSFHLNEFSAMVQIGSSAIVPVNIQAGATERIYTL